MTDQNECGPNDCYEGSPAHLAELAQRLDEATGLIVNGLATIKKALDAA